MTWAACGISILAGMPAHAVGYRLPNQDPDGIARGNAFVATADNPAAIYYNPAGITQLEGHDLRVGIYLLNVNVDYESPAGAKVSNDSGIQPVPQINYVFAPRESSWAFGLGVYVPYGLALEYPEDSVLRPLAIEGSLLYATINPVAAYQITPQLSVAVGPTFNISEVEFKQGIGLSPGDYLKYKGDGFAPGFTAGMRWEPYERWAVGLKYHYQTEVDYDGHSLAYPYAPSMVSEATIRFPQFVTAGVSFRPTPAWNLEFNADWTDWDWVDDITFKGTVAGDRVFPMWARSSWMFEFGVTRYLGEHWHASLGYFFSQNSIPDETFNPIIPDSDLHLGGVGVGYRNGAWSVSLAYQFALNGGRDVSGSLPTPPTGTTADGTYDVFNQALNLAVNLRF